MSAAPTPAGAPRRSSGLHAAPRRTARVYARGAATRIFGQLPQQAPDPLLSLIALYREDPRPQKLDLGVGVYRTASGVTPVFRAVKAAKAALLATQDTKAYLGAEGDVGFLERLAPIVFGGAVSSHELISVQTPGGVGALRLAAELLALSGATRRIWIGVPSWPNHAAIFRKSGLDVLASPYFDVPTQALTFEPYLNSLDDAQPGDAVLLQGSCHNPTGADLSRDQWRQLADLICRRGLVPLIDLAYQGLGRGLEADAMGLRRVLERSPNVIVAQSCDKNFGLYRERTGALFIRTSARDRERTRSNLLELARCAWSMPPDHGAAIVRIILESPELTRQWREELDGMRARLNAVRGAVGAALPRLEPLRHHRGLFAQLPLDAAAVETLRRDHAVYMAGSGRINIAGLAPQTIRPFAEALSPFL